jgi:hypothetical protein
VVWRALIASSYLCTSPFHDLSDAVYKQKILSIEVKEGWQNVLLLLSPFRSASPTFPILPLVVIARDALISVRGLCES